MFMLAISDEEIQKNKETFISLLKEISRQGADIERLISKLESTDFFKAPASTQYHSAFEGGLCLHSLNVYSELKKLISMKYPVKEVENEDGEIVKEETCPYSEDTLKIVALLHDMCKLNFYETSLRNVKNEKGEWEQVPFIKVKDTKDRFLFSAHGANSEFMIRQFIPLEVEESVAVIHHMGYSDEHLRTQNLNEIFNRYPLSLYLHIADMLATYTLERI